MLCGRHLASQMPYVFVVVVGVKLNDVRWAGLLSNVVDRGNQAADLLNVLLQKHPGSLARKRSLRRGGMALSNPPQPRPASDSHTQPPQAPNSR